ncbi:HoxN/HupN/NixA family nickel/cobalt transporter [Deinococcus aquaticus]|uniref:Nickel/cobalt efflux system n=1 Tax=Deinococcus aquaticus TaxID=328692 RepID=A0ABY7V7Y3_9DEIO|nr:high frequency lysogenization protein HflD [Deinococcus aquaticus]WDA60428.1 high frequency lysogenization protein HflD [Deinococcus aquaticus]
MDAPHVPAPLPGVPGGLSARHSARRSAPFLLAVLALHAAGLCLLALSAPGQPLLWGLGLSAYLFGVRHAWDADHIAVIDNTVRRLLTLGRPAYGVGLYFSLGHSGVVLLMAVAAALIGGALLGAQDQIGTVGGWVGPFVAGAYLLVVATLNLSAVARMLRGAPEGHGDHDGHHHGGLLARLIAPLTRLITRPWQVMPLGFLMGLGFDTASEIALLALAGQAGQQSLGWAGILSLPLLFGAGMTLFDTLNGAFMTHAYGWALDRPGARRTYNLLVTGLSGLVALVVGVVTLGAWAAEHFPALSGLRSLEALDLAPLGFGLTGAAGLLFLVAVLRRRLTGAA